MACREEKKNVPSHQEPKIRYAFLFYFLREESPDPLWSGTDSGTVCVYSGVVEKRNVVALKFQLNNYA